MCHVFQDLSCFYFNGIVIHISKKKSTCTFILWIEQHGILIKPSELHCLPLALFFEKDPSHLMAKWLLNWMKSLSWLFNSGVYQDPFLATYAAADRYQVTMATISICLLSQDPRVEHPRTRDYNLTNPASASWIHLLGSDNKSWPTGFGDCFFLCYLTEPEKNYHQ